MTMPRTLADYRDAVRHSPLVARLGQVRHVGGLSIQASGLGAPVGDLCEILPQRAPGGRADGTAPLLAEVVAVDGELATLMPFGSIQGLAAGCAVRPLGVPPVCGVGSALLGRVVDAFGQPLDGGPMPAVGEFRALKSQPVNPLHRPRIKTVLETGIRSVDALLTLGRGQRVGIFSGSGVGKSTLLGMLVRHARVDVNVVALIGERGREVREFIEKQLGREGMARSVVVVATSEQPALTRLRAAYSAVTIAEYFRDRGAQVLLTMDSVTRFAMARREVGLSAGEPPTARGYTPSVFSELPALCERCGTGAGGGSITAVMAVLVDGDDFNEPISDAVRATLDGHIVLSRELTHRGQHPAIDVLKSTSRVMNDIASPAERDLAGATTRHLALMDRYQQLVDIGAYVPGSNAALDIALRVQPRLLQWLRQQEGGCAREESIRTLRDILGEQLAAESGVSTGAAA